MFTPPLDALLVSALLSPLFWHLSRRRRLRFLFPAFIVCSLAAANILLWRLYRRALAAGVIVFTLSGLPNPSVGTVLQADSLSLFIAAVQLLILLTAIVYSLAEMKSARFQYYVLLLAMAFGMMGVVSSGDLFTLYIFWEIMCISSYALVCYGENEAEASEASVKYLLMSSVGAVTILLGVALVQGLAGATNLAYIHIALSGESLTLVALLAQALLIIGFSIQIGIAPAHTWLPDAYVAAPAAVNAVSGVLTATASYSLVRVMLTVFFAPSQTLRSILLLLGLFTAFVGNLSAILQDDLKRLLAFSTVANMGYILYGVGITSVASLTASLFHILNHALSKALLFLCAGTFSSKTRGRLLSDLSGIVHSMPLTYICFLIGVLALSGIPPFNGFWSELLILKASIQEVGVPLTLLLAGNMLLSAAYCLRVLQYTALNPPTEAVKAASEASAATLIPMLLLASLCVAIGLLPDFFYTLSERAALSAFNIDGYVSAVLRR
jgi:proton-translocating NADH-quinone oxidoreductase chain N